MTYSSLRSAALLVVLLAALSGGCAVMVNTDSRTSGTLITEASLDQVTPGETTRDWLIAAFGRPTSAEGMPEGGELLRYEYSETRDSSGSIFLLMAFNEDVVTRHSIAYFELKDNVVQRCWLED